MVQPLGPVGIVAKLARPVRDAAQADHRDGELLAGAVLTEQVFTIPGFGKLIVDAVFNRDYGVVQGVVLCTALGFILMNLLADILYILANPRLRNA